MAEYQGVKLEDIDFKRALFGFFPTYRESPLQPRFDRVIQIGDASGIQVRYRVTQIGEVLIGSSRLEMPAGSRCVIGSPRLERC